MTPEDFDALLTRRLEMTRDVLASKAGQYASKDDRLHNFKKAAGLSRTTPERALFGMVAKHLTAIVDYIVDDTKVPTQEWLDEKIGDVINYFILLEALWTEDIQRQERISARMQEVKVELIGTWLPEGAWADTTKAEPPAKPKRSRPKKQP
jgi:hypothetical protein